MALTVLLATLAVFVSALIYCILITQLVESDRYNWIDIGENGAIASVEQVPHTMRDFLKYARGDTMYSGDTKYKEARLELPLDDTNQFYPSVSEHFPLDIIFPASKKTLSLDIRFAYDPKVSLLLVADKPQRIFQFWPFTDKDFLADYKTRWMVRNVEQMFPLGMQNPSRYLYNGPTPGLSFVGTPVFFTTVFSSTWFVIFAIPYFIILVARKTQALNLAIGANTKASQEVNRNLVGVLAVG